MVGGQGERITGKGEERGSDQTYQKKNITYKIGNTEADTEGPRLTVTLIPTETNPSRNITITNL